MLPEHDGERPWESTPAPTPAVVVRPAAPTPAVEPAAAAPTPAVAPAAAAVTPAVPAPAPPAEKTRAAGLPPVVTPGDTVVVPASTPDDAFAARVRPGDDGGSGAQYLSTAADALSLTDVVWFPTVRRVFLCGYDLRRHPSLWAWHERMRAHQAIAPFVEPMGGLGNAFYVWQYLTGTTLEKFVEAHRQAQPFRLKV